MLNENDKILIDKYLRSSLSEAEQQQLTDRRHDEAFASELAFQHDLQTAAQKLGREDMKSALQAMESPAAASVIRSLRPRRFNRWAVAATILLLLVGATAWYAQHQYSNSALLTAYYEVPNFSGSRGAAQDDLLAQGANAFYAQRYEAAISLLNKHLETSPEDTPSALLLTYAYLENQQTTAAQAQLDAYRPNTNASPEWEWAQALIYLKAEDLARLEPLLEEIVTQQNHPFRLRAEQLLVDLDSGWRGLVW